jgi:putative ATP-binding cassette transporter
MLKNKEYFDMRFLLIMAIVGGISNALILAIINNGAYDASNNDLSLYELLIYAIAFLVYFLSKKYGLSYTAHYVEKVVKKIKDRVSNKIRESELSTLERFEDHSSHIYKTLTQDTNFLSYVGAVLINSAQSSIMLFFALIYILYLSPIAFLVIFSVMFLGSIMYLRINYKILALSDKAAVYDTEFITSMQGILKGFKEIKINMKKSDELYQDHEMITEKIKRLKTTISLNYMTLGMFFEVVLYLLIASVVFVLPRFFQVEDVVIVQLVASLLFIISPLEKIIDSFPVFAQANVAISSIENLEKTLDEKNSIKTDNINSIRLKNIQFNNTIFEYHDKNDNNLFKIGPINLTINKGDTIFIVGGNGSGKSTFIKLLLGLYLPQSGSISLNNDPLSVDNYQSYRELFSIVLTDFHLFNKLYGIDTVKYEKVKPLLEKMQLSNKTDFVDGGFTNKNLSTGQRKRLALIHSILEDKQIYIFDEWAADQDPEFKRYFYEEILVELKQKGKTLILVSHDDQYFHLADRVYKFEYGSIHECNYR